MKLATSSMLKHVSSEGLVEISDEQFLALHEVLISIVEDIVGYCDENHLKYFLGGGSCLGAVRHQGFIPWDDDVDLDMPRKDFEVFKSGFLKRFGDKYWLHLPGETDGYGVLVCRVVKRGTRLRCHDAPPAESGVFVDIFIQENAFDSKIMRLAHGALCQAASLAVSCARFYAYRDMYFSIARGNGELLQAVRVKTAIGFLLSWRTVKQWAALADRICSLCKNDSSEYVTYPAGKYRYFGEMRKRGMFGEGKLVSFEGHQWRVPAEVDSYLSEHYGDYMSIPDEAEREKHAYLEFDLGE